MQQSITSSAIWNIFARIFPLVITFFLTPVLISSLGIGHYGLYMLIMSVSGLMSVMSFGLGDATVRYVAYYHNLDDLDGVNRVFRSTLLVYLLVGFISVFLIIILAPNIVNLFAIDDNGIDLAIKLFRFTAIGFFLTLLNSVVNAVLQALQRYDINARIVVSVAIVQAVATLLLLSRGYGIFALICLGIVVQCLSIFLNYRVVRALVPAIKIWPSFSRAGLREVFGYGVFSFLSQALGMSFSYSDRLLAGSFINVGSVGFLTVPQDLAFRALSLVSQGGTVLFPRFSVIDDLQERACLYMNASWAMLFLSSIIFVPLTIFMSDFISLWINPEFASKCSHVGQLIAASSVVRGAFVTYESLFKGINKPQYVTILSLFVGGLSLTLNCLLIPRFGIEGAGYSYCCTALLGVITVILTWKYVLGISDFFELLRSFFLPVGLAFVCMAAGFKLKLIYAPVGWIGLIVGVALAMLVTAAVLFGADRISGSADSCSHVFQRGLMRALRLRTQ